MWCQSDLVKINCRKILCGQREAHHAKPRGLQFVAPIRPLTNVRSATILHGRRNKINMMISRKLLLLALGAGVVDALRDTSPFILLSTSE